MRSWSHDLVEGGAVASKLATLASYITALRLLGRGGTKRISRAVTEEAKSLTDETFRRGIDPTGKAWAPLRTRSGQPLRDTGRLQRSLAPVDTGRGFRLSTSLIYARLHQQGGRVTARKSKGLYNARTGQHFGRSVRIPARPFLPRQTGALPARWSKALEQAAREAISLLLRKR